MSTTSMTSSMDQNNNRSPLKKPDLNRKKRKPLMEKRRRARINASLEQLKKLVLDATRRDSARYSKLEKADILELTVRHLRDTQRTNINFALHHDPSVLSKFGDGFGECATEVGRYLSTVDGVPKEIHSRLMSHLSNCTQNVHTVTNANTAAAGVRIPPQCGDFPPPSPTHRVIAPHPQFVFNQQGLQMFHGSSPHNLPLKPMVSPTTPTGTPMTVLPGHNAQMKHSPPTSPHNIHERIFHSQFSTIASPGTDLQRPQSEPTGFNQQQNCDKVVRPSALYKVCDKRSPLQNPLNNVTKQRLLNCYNMDVKNYSSNHLLSIKSEPIDNEIRRDGNEIMREHARFMESVHMLSKENVWRPW